jgi:hypothetical protein
MKGDGWRLPTRIELASLVDFTTAGPAISASFTQAPSKRFWTSSLAAYQPNAAWGVDFETGAVHQWSISESYTVRCVLGGSRCPPMRYLSQQGQPARVFDAATGLTWQRDFAPGRPWSEAIAFCRNLGSGWRLPSVTELQTIVDETQENPAIDRDAFPNTPKMDSYFWTSSRQVKPPPPGGDFAWYVTFIHGHADTDPVTFQRYVRCVRLDAPP